MRKRLLIGGAAASGAAAALFLGGLWRSSSPGAVRVTADAAAASIQGGFAAGNTQALVAQLQAQLRVHPGAKGFALLGLAYQQRARETGDPSWYPKSEGLLRQALQLEPRDLTASAGLASLALSRHRFGHALLLARRVLEISPTTAAGYGLLGDALVELGRYRRAFAAFDRFGSMKPSLAAYARLSYAAELVGDVRGARRAMLLAHDAATGEAEPSAWTDWQLGKLAFAHDRYRDAERRYSDALRAFPGYVYALDALAALRAAQHRFGEAIALERRAVDKIPLPQFLAQLGDLYAARGHAKLAREQYATISVIERLLRANGVQSDLETALFDADHGRGSIVLARRAQRERPSIDGDDVLAWTLARGGRCNEALKWSQRALRLETQDALKFFHRAAIESCLGRRAAARVWARRALALNPHFSLLWGGTAKRLAT